MAPTDSPKRGLDQVARSPFGSFALLILVLGVLVTVVISTVPGIVLIVLGVGCLVTELVSPGRDFYGRRRG